MPTFDYKTPMQRDPRRWADCLRLAKKQLIEEGFEPLSAKLPDAQHRRARKLFNRK